MNFFTLPTPSHNGVTWNRVTDNSLSRSVGEMTLNSGHRGDKRPRERRREEIQLQRGCFILRGTSSVKDEDEEYRRILNKL